MCGAYEEWRTKNEEPKTVPANTVEIQKKKKKNVCHRFSLNERCWRVLRHLSSCKLDPSVQKLQFIFESRPKWLCKAVCFKREYSRSQNLRIRNNFVYKYSNCKCESANRRRYITHDLANLTIMCHFKGIKGIFYALLLRYDFNFHSSH